MTAWSSGAALDDKPAQRFRSSLFVKRLQRDVCVQEG